MSRVGRTEARPAARVHDSLKEGRGHDANQGAVWNEVAACLSMSAAESPSAYAKRDHELTEFRGSLRMPETAVGVAVFHGGRFQGLDLFDRHSTLKYFWESRTPRVGCERNAYKGSPLLRRVFVASHLRERVG
jgi:hypothetical protein